MPKPRPSFRERTRQALYVWRRLFPYLGMYRGRLFAAFSLTTIVVLAELAKPWPLKVVIDQVLGNEPWAILPAEMTGRENAGTLALLAGAAVLVFSVITGFASYFRDLWLAETGQKVVNRVRRHTLERMLLMSLQWHEKHRRGDMLLRLVGDASQLRVLLIDGLFSLIREGLLVFGTLAVMLVMDWRLALMAVAVMPAIAVMTSLFGVKLRGAARKQRAKEGDLATSVHETMSSIPVIQAYGLEEQAAEAFTKANRKSAKAGLAATRLEGRLGIGAEVALALGIGLTLYYGAMRVAADDSDLTAGDLLVMLAYVRSFYKPIRKGMQRSSAMIKAAAAGERILHLLDAVPDLPWQPQPKRIANVRGQITIDHVSFRHGDGRQVLADASLRIEAGQHIALLGANGSGKTTLATLLPRLRDVDAGAVRIDGVDVRELGQDQLRGAVALVFQETVLFDATLRENVLLGRPDATPAEVESAAKCAGVTVYSDRWADGLDTEVGERGASLSGGERQRVALARALVRNAPIVVLDEPTTGLDAANEERLCTEVLARLRGRTVLLITHNPRVLEAVDRVVRLVDGKLVDVDKRTGQQILSGPKGNGA